MNEKQVEVLRRSADRAIIELAQALMHDRAALTELAIERATTIGVAEYGDAAFGKTFDELQTDVAEELADAIFYQHLMIAKRRKVY